MGPSGDAGLNWDFLLSHAVPVTMYPHGWLFTRHQDPANESSVNQLNTNINILSSFYPKTDIPIALLDLTIYSVFQYLV